MNTRNNIAAALIEESKDKACDGMIPQPDDELESRQCNENNKSASSKWRLDNIVPSPKLSKASDVIGEVQWVNEVTMQSQNKTPLRNKKAVLCEGKQSTTRIKSPAASVLLASTPNSGLPEATSTEHRFEQQEQTTAKWHSRRKKLHTNKKNRCYLDKSRQGPKETTFNRQRTPTTRGKSSDSSDNDEPISLQCSIRKRLSSPKNAPEPLEDVQYPGSDSICDSSFLSLPAPPCTPILPAARSRKRYYRGTVKTPRSKRRKVLRPPLQSSNDGVVATDSLSSSLCTPSKPCGKVFCFHCMWSFIESGDNSFASSCLSHRSARIYQCCTCQTYVIVFPTDVQICLCNIPF